MRKLIECVPNFSEGKDKGKINSIVSKIESIDDIGELSCSFLRACGSVLNATHGNKQRASRFGFSIMCRTL